ncbi:MAG: M18 family aminopeptidase [Treponema sp.]|nr:M18 family aminopeptidase [Treponema sp.]
MQTESNTYARELLSFIEKSPSPFHVVKNLGKILESHGFVPLSEKEPWSLGKGKYFVTRNNSSIISFTIPRNDFSSFKIAASHSDSPTFKVKENPEIRSGGATVLNVEKYGGMILSPWFDRPLSVAGRVMLRKNAAEGKISVEQKLVESGRDLLLIPNLAIHMDRETNEGRKINVQNEIRPVMALGENASLMEHIAGEIGADAKDIISHDLFLYVRSAGTIWGENGEFMASPKLDDLECVWTTMRGFLEAAEKDDVCVHAVFDNEETGSQSMQGAASSFLSDTLARISRALGKTAEEHCALLSKSFMVSADNAHALHPNYAEKSDPVNRPKINGGVVIKFNAAQKYTTDSLSAAVFKEICRKAGVPFQIFTNNSNIAGGSTLGNISLSHVSVPCVDIGLAQWAMHSPYESAGTKDVDYMIRAAKAFYEAEIEIN